MTIKTCGNFGIPDDPRSPDDRLWVPYAAAEELQLREELHLKWRPKNGGFQPWLSTAFFFVVFTAKNGALISPKRVFCIKNDVSTPQCLFYPPEAVFNHENGI